MQLFPVPPTVAVESQNRVAGFPGTACRCRGLCDDMTSRETHPMARNQSIDMLRALSLFGILVVNLPFFAIPGGFAGTAWEGASPRLLDIGTSALIQGLFENKFILIFSALFGFGAWQQMGRNPGRYYKRLGLLAGFGAMNMLFLFGGDILMPYAILGLALPLMNRLSNRQMLAAAIALWVAAIHGNLGFGILHDLSSPPQGHSEQPAIDPYLSPDFWQVAMTRMLEWKSFQFYSLCCNYPMVAAAMLGGMVAARQVSREGFVSLKTRLTDLAKLLWLPALAGNLAYAIFAALPSAMEPWRFTYVTLIFRPLFAVPLSLCIVALILTVAMRVSESRIAGWLAPAGRMSLTIYLGMSLVGSLIFFGYGLGLKGQVTLPQTVMITAVIALGFILAAAGWEPILGRGPAERLLKFCMNLPLQPLRRSKKISEL